MPEKYFELPNREDLTSGILLDSYKIISSQQYTKENVAILFNHAYVIEGVLARELVGMPGQFSATDPGNSILEVAEFKKLERECENHIALSNRFGGEANAAAPDANLDPATILFIVKSIMELIALLRKKRS